MNFVTEDLAEYVQEHVPHAGKVDKDIYYDYSPKGVDNIVAFVEYAGTGVATWTNTSVRSVQCMVRNKSNTAAMKLIWDVYSSLKPDEPFTQFKKVIAIVSMRNTPFRIATDDSGRSVWVFNMGITYNYK